MYTIIFSIFKNERKVFVPTKKKTINTHNKPSLKENGNTKKKRFVSFY